MHLKKRFPFNESNVMKKKLQKTGKYMYGRQVDIKKKYVSAMLIFLRDVGRAFLYCIKTFFYKKFKLYIVSTSLEVKFGATLKMLVQCRMVCYK